MTCHDLRARRRMLVLLLTAVLSGQACSFELVLLRVSGLEDILEVEAEVLNK